MIYHCFSLPPGGFRRDLGHRPVADFIFGVEVSGQQIGEPLPEVGGVPKPGIRRQL